MQEHDPRACAGTALVTLLAIAGFFCIVAVPQADSHPRWHHAQAHVDADCDAAVSTGEPQ